MTSRRTTLSRKAIDSADYARQLDQDDDDDDADNRGNDNRNFPVVEKDDDSSSSSSEKSKKTKMKKKRTSSKQSVGDPFWTTTTESLKGINGRAEEHLCQELKPVFHDNQVLFEPPVALEPIQLHHHAETDNGRRHHEYQVPASMARYMYDFHHDGVRFMFRAIMTHRAAILGDGEFLSMFWGEMRCAKASR
jgi:hypothetical protein